MAAITVEQDEFNLGPLDPKDPSSPLIILRIDMTYDDVTLIVASFTTINPGPPRALDVVLNGSRVTPDPSVPTGTHTFAVNGITLLPGLKGPSPRFPFTVSISPA